MERTNVFISYSRKDEKWLNRLKTHLKFLERDHEFAIWDDSQIGAGVDWKRAIEQAMASSKIAILLVSAHYIASDFISNEELPPLLQAAKNEGAHIFPIVLSPCMFAEVNSLSGFQSFNAPSRPLSVMTESEQDEVFVEVTKTLLHVLSAAYSGRKTKKESTPEIRLERKFELAIARVRTMLLFYADQSEHGLSVTALYQQSKVSKRKDIVLAIQEMEKGKIIEKTKLDKGTFYKLTESGKRFIQRVGEPMM